MAVSVSAIRDASADDPMSLSANAAAIFFSSDVVSRLHTPVSFDQIVFVLLVSFIARQRRISAAHRAAILNNVAVGVPPAVADATDVLQVGALAI
jgi:hypothetical protein